MATVFAAHYLDGQTPVRRRASVRVAATGLEIAVEGGATLWWPLGAIRQTQGIYAGEQIRLERGGAMPETLLVDDPALLVTLRGIGAAGRRLRGPRRPRLRVLVTALAPRAGPPRGRAAESRRVARRHPTRPAGQHTPGGLLAAAAAGDVSALGADSLEAARILGTLRYSRRDEAEADAGGRRMLATARVD